MAPHPVDHAAFWQELYDAQRDGWELTRPAPPLVDWFDSPAAPPPGRALVPGCGRGHEALMLAARGHQVIGIDFADTAIAGAREAARRAQLHLAFFVQADWFGLPAAPPWPEGADLIVEHTFYCAIDPERRDEYADSVAALLRPGGRFVGLFWAHGRDGGPPWTTSAGEVADRFGRRLVIDSLRPAEASVAARAGQEWLLEAHRPDRAPLSPLP